jgi:serine/threonine-protein kinase
MTSSRWKRIQDLFHAALQLEPDARPAFLDEACADDDDLRREIESLVEAHGRPGPIDDLAEEVIDPLFARLDDGPAEDERVGPHRVIRRIARGGMGDVFLAERDDGQFQRRVALKFVRIGLAGDESLRRFAIERQILARLAHPNIASLLDGGVSTRGPYLAMEYVEGTPIDQYCDEERLSVDRRLELFCEVCDGVQYAHQNLVVHRDLKPGNIYVTREGRVKLLDFGIAKLLAEDPGEEATLATVRWMTPEYASPEQVRGATITTASDTYALGVLLYRMLTGRRPYEIGRGTPQEMERAICETEPSRPSAVVLRMEENEAGADGATGVTPESVSRARATQPRRLQRRLAGDLDTIVLKALRKEPGRRYGTAGELADDLRRHRRGMPVRARADTLGYRAAKFVRRHWIGVAASAVIAVSLVGGVAATSWQASRTAVERDRAEQVIDFMVGLFASANPAYSRGDTVTVREVLDRGAVRVRQELSAQPAVQATLMEVIGEVYASLGLSDSAVALFGEALTTRRQGIGDDDPGLTKTVRRLAMFQTEVGRFEIAEPLLGEALERLRRSGTRGTQEYASALTDIGYAWQVQGKSDLAEQLLTEALTEFEKLPEPPSGMGAALTNLGYMRVSDADLDSAEVLFRRAVEVRRRFGAEEEAALAISLEALAGALMRQGALEAADSAVTEALAIRRAILPEGHYLIAGSIATRGGILRRQGRPADAEPFHREALAMRIASFGEDHFIVAYSRNDLAITLQEQGREAEAEALFREAWLGYDRYFGSDHTNTAIVEANLARLQFRMGNREAKGHFAHALPIVRPVYPQNLIYMRDRVSLGTLRCQAGESVAVGELQEVADELRAAEEEDSEDEYLETLNALGSCLAQRGQVDEARLILALSLEASSGRPDDDPYRTFALRVVEDLRAR